MPLSRTVKTFSRPDPSASISTTGSAWSPMYFAAFSIRFCQIAVSRGRSPKRTVGSVATRTCTPRSARRPATASRASRTSSRKGARVGGLRVRPARDISRSSSSRRLILSAAVRM